MNDDTKVRPVSLNKAIYRDRDDDLWYWKSEWYSKPVGPFTTRERARENFRSVMGVKRNTEK